MGVSAAAGSSTTEGVQVPDLVTFCGTFSPKDPRNKAVKALYPLLTSFDDQADLQSRLEQLELLSRWVCKGPKPPPVDATVYQPPDEPAATARLRLLTYVLAQVAPMRSRVRVVLASVLAETHSLRLFCESGLPNDRGLFVETLDRLSRRFLPTPSDHSDLAELIARLFKTEKDAEWLETLPREVAAAFADVLGEPWEPVRDALTDAMALLATRVSALGLSDDIRRRSPEGPLRESPFFRLPHAPAAQLPQLIEDCRRDLAVVTRRLENYGVSVDVVYRLEVISRSLDRMMIMLPLVGIDTPAENDSPPEAASQLLGSLVRSRVRDRRLGEIVGSNLRMLARKVIERAGSTGEHYITSNRREYWAMIASAAGGGFLTIFTLFAKYWTKDQHYAPFVDGMANATNYAVSFIIMQLCGFTLATKQPSMTAAALAGSIKQKREQGRLTDLVKMIARITRSQLAAALGNIGMMVPTAIAFNMVYRAQTGHDFMTEKMALKTVASFHPWKSGTIPYAALTGVLLWMSSIGAGWLENWAVYRRLPDGIAEHRLGKVVGRGPMRWLGRFLGRNIAGFGGNATLGLLLGMTPTMGRFFGLPLDIRHVTLSTGTLTLAGCALGPSAVSSEDFLWAMVGIVIIGILNFGVSFTLAMGVALRARDVGRAEGLGLVWAVFKRWLRHPLEFYYPPRGEPSVHDLEHEHGDGHAHGHAHDSQGPPGAPPAH